MSMFMSISTSMSMFVSVSISIQGEILSNYLSITIYLRDLLYDIGACNYGG